MPSVVFEPTFSAGERPQTYALDRTVTGIELAILPYDNIHGKSLSGYYKIGKLGKCVSTFRNIRWNGATLIGGVQRRGVPFVLSLVSVVTEEDT